MWTPSCGPCHVDRVMWTPCSRGKAHAKVIDACVEHAAIADEGLERVRVEPSTHTLMSSASPGITGDAKRPAIDTKRAGIAVAHRVQQPARRESVGAQAVQDRHVEAAHGRERRVAVQRVAVAVQPIQQRLVGAGLIRHHMIRRSGRCFELGRRTTIATPAALAAYEHRRRRGEQLVRRCRGRWRSTP